MKARKLAILFAITTSLFACQWLAGFDRIALDTSEDGAAPEGGVDGAPADADGSVDGSIVEKVGEIETVATGDRSACLLSKAGKVWCWGNARDGRLGLPEEGDKTCDEPIDGGALPVRCRPSPTAPVPLPPAKITHVAAGGAFACARGDNGAVWCWGKNDLGQLGNTVVASSATPVQVAGLPYAFDVVAGPNTACARVQGDSMIDVWCWGSDANGALGRRLLNAPAPPLPARPPNRVLDLPSDALSVHFSRLDSVCALTRSGAYCWGFAGYGMLGRADTSTDKPCPYQSGTCNARPLRVDFDVDDIAVAGASFCTFSKRPFRCWGSNRWSTLGYGGVPDNNVHPVLVTAMQAESFSKGSFIGIASTFAHACGVSANGEIGCWGSNSRGEISRFPFGVPCGDGWPCYPTGGAIDGAGVSGGLPAFSAVYAGVFYTLALARDGKLWGWGSNSEGLLGHMPGDRGDRACVAALSDDRSTRCNPVPQPIPMP